MKATFIFADFKKMLCKNGKFIGFFTIHKGKISLKKAKEAYHEKSL